MLDLDLSHFNTENVLDTDRIFWNTYNLNSVNLNGWDVSNILPQHAADDFSGTNSSITVYCDQGGSPGTGSIFGKTCEAESSTSESTSPCPDGYILVPSNSEVGVQNDFCVMKYEAKAWNDVNSDDIIDYGEVNANGCNEVDCTTDNWGLSNHIPVSMPENHPWRKIDQASAKSECTSLGANYDLISNPEWMTIARNVESVDTNWSGGSVGSGCLFRGNNGLDDDCGYNGSDLSRVSIEMIKQSIHFPMERKFGISPLT